MPSRGGLAAGHWSSSSSLSQVQGSAAHASAFSGGSGLARLWEQWRQARRRCGGSGTEAAAAAAAALPSPSPQPQPARRPAPIMAAMAQAAAAPTVVGGARLTAAIKATRDPQALLELLRGMTGGGDSGNGSSPAGRRRPPPPTFSSSSSINALHAAAALAHLAQLMSRQEAEEAAARGSLMVWPRERAAGGEEEEATTPTAQQPSPPALLLSLAETHADRFTPRQCANVMWAISKLGWMDAGATAEEARRARRLVDALAGRLDGRAQPLWPQLQPQELVMALEACAAVAAAQGNTTTTIPTWLRGCVAALADATPLLGAREHCSSAAALARLAAAAGSDANTADFIGRSLRTVVLDPALRGAWAYSPRDVAALLQAVSLLPARGGGLVRPPPHAWTSAFLRAATDGPDARRAAAAGAAGVGGPLYMTDAAWSGRDGRLSDEDDDNHADADNDARAAASALAALARLGFSPPAAWLAPRLRALGSAEAFRALGPGGLALLGHAVARSGVRPPVAWTRAWLGAVLESWGASSSRRPPTSQEAAMVFWTLAKLRARPSSAWMRELSAEAARAVMREGGGNTTAVASSTVLWALARIGYRPSPAVERALLLRAVWMPDDDEDGAAAAASRRLAVSLAAVARLRHRRRRAATPADPLPPGVLTAWLRAAARAGMCDVVSPSSSLSSSSLQRARATGAWALATLAAPVPPEWRRPFFAAAAAGLLRFSAVAEDDSTLAFTAASHRLDQAATVAWAAAEEGGAADATTAAVLAALAVARRPLLLASDGAWHLHKDCRRATSGALLCIWSGARMAQRQEELEEEEPGAPARARRLRRAIIGAMRAFAAAALDDEGAIDVSGLSDRDLLLLTRATALLLLRRARGQEEERLPAAWLALSAAARGAMRRRRRLAGDGTSRHGDSAD